jgi:CubicO group peptidase (beta-lactamase class C family)
LFLLVLLTLVGGLEGGATTGWLATPPELAGGLSQQAHPTYSEYGEKIEAARAVVLERMNRFPGLSVSVGIDGQIVWAEGFGWADLEQRVPVRATSRFRVGSVAKPMTAALLGLVYEEGKIDLDATVQTYVANFPEKEYPITVRQLAGHLAGIRHYQGDEFLSSVYYETVSDGLPIFADDPLLFEPGTRYSYSTYAWNLLSAVIENVSSGSFLEQMQSQVFEPLGMLDTTADRNEMIIADRVRPYVRDDDGKFRNAPHVDNSYKWAGGGFLSTAGDLVRFGLAHMAPGFLEAETLDEWFTSQRTADGEETGYGIGWSVSGQEGNRRVSHGGGSVGGTTTLGVYLDQGLVIAMVTNLSNGGGFPVDEIAEIFLR